MNINLNDYNDNIVKQNELNKGSLFRYYPYGLYSARDCELVVYLGLEKNGLHRYWFWNFKTARWFWWNTKNIDVHLDYIRHL